MLARVRAGSAEVARSARAVAMVVAAWLAASPTASALDVEVDSDVSFQLYEIRAPDAAVFIARRRFVGSLGLRLVEPLTEPDESGRRIRVLFGGRLRIDQGFSEDCLVDGSMCVRATDRETRADYQPLAADTRVDVPALSAELTGLPLGGAVALGRQLRVDAIGFTRFDGLSLSITPVPALGLEVYGGSLVRGTSLGGSSQFEIAGPRTLAQSDAIGREPILDPHRDAWVVGARARAGMGPLLSGTIDVRYAADSRGEILRRAGLALASSPHEAVRLDAQGTLDLLDLELIAALLAAEVRAGPLTLRAAFDHRVPRFDPSTIWAWFDVAPVQQVRLGAVGRVTDDLEIGGAVRGRRVERSPDEDLDAGLELHTRVRVEGIQLGASGFAWTGALGPLAGVAIEASRAIAHGVSVEGQLSVWHFDDPVQADAYGTVVSTILSGRWQITREAVAFLELQHAHSRGVGHRFRGMLALQVMTWR